MRHLSALAAVALVFSVTAALADPVGKYDIEGTNPGSDTSYSGTVSVERTGQTYRVVWVVSETRSIGTGVGNKDLGVLQDRQLHRACSLRTRRRRLGGGVGLCRGHPVGCRALDAAVASAALSRCYIKHVTNFLARWARAATATSCHCKQEGSPNWTREGQPLTAPNRTRRTCATLERR